MTDDTATELIRARNGLQAHCAPILNAARSLPVASAAAELAKAQRLTAALGCEMNDSEATSAAALIQAAQTFIAVAEAAHDVVLGPTNFRSEDPKLDAALRAAGV